ncbi:MAG TPA: hypothetical protein DCS55_01315 [Acidimicrobiaceae bacterium]|nr:hypothetical protein [Acidimicrobiaceae bacterium]
MTVVGLVYLRMRHVHENREYPSGTAYDATPFVLWATGGPFSCSWERRSLRRARPCAYFKAQLCPRGSGTQQRAQTTPDVFGATSLRAVARSVGLASLLRRFPLVPMCLIL